MNSNITIHRITECSRLQAYGLSRRWPGCHHANTHNDMLADGVTKEKKLKSKEASKEARNKIWLPVRNPLRNVLSLSEAQSVK